MTSNGTHMLGLMIVIALLVLFWFAVGVALGWMFG